jgi:hypothetical protein
MLGCTCCCLALQISESEDVLTRTYFSSAHKKAAHKVG